VILLVGSYVAPDPARMVQYAECLERNLGNDVIEEIHVFVEDDPNAYARALSGAAPGTPLARLAGILAHSKVRIVGHGSRTTYGEFFAYANRYFPGRIVVVSNADIYFDSSLALLEDVDLDGVLVSLSKYDGDTLFKPECSQDSWVFRAPIRRFPCEWPLGRLGCEERLSFEAARAGLRVVNPCLSVIARHLDVPKAHDESTRLRGKYSRVPPSDIGVVSGGASGGRAHAGSVRRKGSFPRRRAGPRTILSFVVGLLRLRGARGTG
jgi:hypothetical protein